MNIPSRVLIFVFFVITCCPSLGQNHHSFSKGQVTQNLFGQKNTLFSPTDVLVVKDDKDPDPGRRSIYLADPFAGAIYAYDTTDYSTKRISFKEFRPFFQSSQFRNPSALAYKNGKLLVCDKKAAVVYEIDPITQLPKVLMQGSPLYSPSALGVSDEGEVVVADSESNSIIFINPRGTYRVVDFKFESPVRIINSNSMLLVLTATGRLYHIDPSLKVSEIFLPHQKQTSVERGRDVGAFQNIFYLADTAGIRTATLYANRQFREKEEALPFIYENNQQLYPDRISVGDRYVVALYKNTQSVLQFTRPVPVNVEFNGDSQDTTTVTILLYKYLITRKQLPVKEYEAAKPATLLDILVENQIVFSKLTEKSEEISTLTSVICDLNPEFCNSSTSPSDLLNRKFEKRQRLKLPDLAIQRYETTSLISLFDKTLEEHLTEIFPNQQDRDRYIENRFYKDNPRIDADPHSPTFSKLRGSFRLPVFRWKTFLLINALDLTLTSYTSLFKLFEKHNVYLFPTQNLQLERAASVSGQKGILSYKSDLTAVTKNRTDLKTHVHHSDDLLSSDELSGIYVALAERESDVDFDHPDFTQNGESVWFEIPSDDTGIVRRTIKEKHSSSDSKVGSNFSEVDHGTHIAGLIAARTDSIASGFLPTLKGLILVNTENPSELRKNVNSAIAEGVSIFNLSFTLPKSSDFSVLGNNLEQSMKYDWADKLFIVAAGNTNSTDDQDMDKTTSAEPPIKWGESKRNIIGVSAVTQAGSDWVLMNPVTSSDDVSNEGGAKFGKKYVQLVAPGKNIFSSSKNNTYKMASGTSFAVPQVTAAVALLFAQSITTNSTIKARLMYTSDWYASFADKVYGGLLNIRRAAWKPTMDLVRLKDSPATLKNVDFERNPNISIISGRLESPDSPTRATKENFKIKFRNIYRIWRQPGPQNVYRVFFFDEGSLKLRIIYDAILEGRIKCSKNGMRDWNKATLSFSAATGCSSDGFLDVTDFADFVADIRKVPENLEF